MFHIHYTNHRASHSGRPSELVAAQREKPVAVFLIATVAPGMTAWCSSTTVPEMLPVEDWGERVPTVLSVIKRRQTATLERFS